MKTRTLIIAGLTSFLLTSLTQIPARLVTNLLPANLPIKLQGVSGSLWQGYANSLSAPNLQLRDVEWDLQFAALFKGQLAAELRGQLAQGGKIDGLCSINALGNVQCSNLNVTDLPAQALSPYLQRLMVPPLRGQFQASLDSLSWDRENLPQGSGRVEWQEAGVQLTPQNFGQYSAILSMDADDNQQISLTSAPDAAFALDGQITVKPERQYQTNINIKPGQNTDPGIKQFLGFIGGKPQPDGSYRLEQQGSF